MPFTLAHPIAVMPLRKPLGEYGILSALVVGSMAPDFAYFLPVTVSRFDSHSLAGIFWFCLPLGLVAYYVFHLLLAPVLIPLLPEPVQVRLPAQLSRGLPPEAPFIGVVVSLLIGIVTHLAWDLLTHVSSPLVASTPLLRLCLFEISGCRVHLYRALQHGSTVVGLALLIWLIIRWYKATEPIDDPKRPRGSGTLRIISASCLAILPAIAGAWSGLSHIGDGPWPVQLQRCAGYTFMAAGTGLWLAWLALGLAFRVVQPLCRPDVDSPVG